MIQRRPTRAAFLIAIVALLSVSSIMRAEDTRPPRKLAFVVGVSKYEKDGLHDLNYAQKDAEDLAAELGRHGFVVTTVLGDKATRDGLEAKLNEFFKDLKKLGKEDVVFMAFAGHGQQLMVSENDRQIETPFFCPYDCLKTDPTTLISLNWVMQRIKDDSGSSQNLLVVDACRNNPARGDRGIDGSTVTELPNKLSILFGSSSGTRSFESNKVQQGVLTHFLLQGLRGKAQAPGGDITWLTLASYVMQSVPAEVAGLLDDPKARQQPNLLGNLGKQPVLAHADGAFLPGEAERETLSDNECKRRVAKAREMLAKVEADFEAGRLEEKSDPAYTSKPNYAAMLAWNYAYLGDTEKVKHYSPMIDDPTGAADPEHDHAIKSRILGLLEKHQPTADLEKDIDALRSDAKSDSDRQAISKGLLLADSFGSELTFNVQMHRLDAALEKSPTYECFGAIVQERQFIVGRFASQEMPRRLKKLEAKAEGDTDRLIIEALRGNAASVATLLRTKKETPDADSKPDSIWMTHKAYWVIPFAMRGEVATLRTLLELETPANIMAARWLAAETLADAGRFHDAGNILSDIDLKASANDKDTGIVLCVVGLRAYPLPREGFGGTAVMKHYPLCHLAGRLNNERFYKELAATKKVSGPMADLCFIDGLLADVPLK